MPQKELIISRRAFVITGLAVAATLFQTGCLNGDGNVPFIPLGVLSDHLGELEGHYVKTYGFARTFQAEYRNASAVDGVDCVNEGLYNLEDRRTGIWVPALIDNRIPYAHCEQRTEQEVDPFNQKFIQVVGKVTRLLNFPDSDHQIGLDVRGYSPLIDLQ